MPPRSASRSLVLAIDVGSSSVRSALFRETARRLPATLASRSYAIRYSADGAAELDAMVLLRATRQCIAETLRTERESRSKQRAITAVSGSGFWHGLLGLDAARQPITPVFTWADSRSKADAAQLRSEFDERDAQLRTGCMLRAQFWPAKLRWLRRTNRPQFDRVARWTSPASWIFGELFGTAAVSHSMASGTGLYDMHRRDWARDICEACRVRPEQLDAISDQAPQSKRVSLLRGATIFSAIGDGAASNLGSGADRDGVAAINLGTSGAVRVVQKRSEAAVRNLAPGFFVYVVDAERLVIGGAISNAGNLHQWCRRELRLESGDAERALRRDRAAADQLTVLPFWVDERAPNWPDAPRGTIAGLTPTTAAADILRAATTSTFYRLAAILDGILRSLDVKQIIVSGGILHSPASLRILADCLARDVHACRELESSLRGAAVYALQQLGGKPERLAAGRLVRHDRAFAAKHRQRRARQEALEQLLAGFGATPPPAPRSPRPARKRS